MLHPTNQGAQPIHESDKEISNCSSNYHGNKNSTMFEVNRNEFNDVIKLSPAEIEINIQKQQERNKETDKGKTVCFSLKQPKKKRRKIVFSSSSPSSKDT